MNKIMQGGIKNSYDQSNEDYPTKEIQTDEILYDDFENQCPEDFFRTFTKKNEENEDDYINLAHTQKFTQYIYLLLKKKILIFS